MKVLLLAWILRAAALACVTVWVNTVVDITFEMGLTGLPDHVAVIGLCLSVAALYGTGLALRVDRLDPDVWLP